MVAQYIDYSPLPGKAVDGKLTLGKNIADLSGLAIAFEDESSPVLDGLTGEQRSLSVGRKSGVENTETLNRSVDC